MADDRGPDPARRASPAGHGRFDDIDSLRALAMTAVVAQHCHVLPFGWMGVWLFFVISGFVVTTSLMSRRQGGRAALLGGFYLRRAARILPIYVAYVGIGFGLSWRALGWPEWSPLSSLLLFYNNFQSAFGVGTFRRFPVGHLWTLSVEMQFYAVFALAFAFLPVRRLIVVLLAMLAIAPVLRFLGGQWLVWSGYSPLRAAFAIYAVSPMHFDSFALGALLALRRGAATPGATGGAAGRGDGTWEARALMIIGIAALVAYAAVYVLVNHARGAMGLAMFRNVVSGIIIGQSRQVWLYSAIALASVGVLAMTLTGRAPWSLVTRARWLQAVGRASYGGYIYHPLFVMGSRTLLRAPAHPAGLAARLEHGALEFALALTGTILVSLLSYHVLERPIIAWASRRLALWDTRRGGTSAHVRP